MMMKDENEDAQKSYREKCSNSVFMLMDINLKWNFIINFLIRTQTHIKKQTNKQTFISIQMMFGIEIN